MGYIRVDAEELINTFRVPKVGRRLRPGYMRKNVVASLFLDKAHLASGTFAHFDRPSYALFSQR